MCVARWLWAAAASVLWVGSASAQTCESDVRSSVDSDETLSGTLQAGSFGVRNGAVLTIEPGTIIEMCPGASLKVESGGRLVAVGTEADPIIFRRAVEGRAWQNIELAFSSDPTSRLQWLRVEGAGGTDPDALVGAVQIAPEATAVAGPILTNLTIEDSGSFGLLAVADQDDRTPPVIRDLTIRGSPRHPAYLTVPTVASLGGTNTFEDNGTQQLLVDLSTKVAFSMTWSRQPVPYELIDGPLGVNGPRRPTLTVEAGVEMVLDSFGGFIIGSVNDPATAGGIRMLGVDPNQPNRADYRARAEPTATTSI